MKKAIVSPLCSGLIIPGMGQIMNQELKKGGLLLGAVFVLFVVGIIRLAYLVHSVFGTGDIDISNPDMIMARLRAENLTLLWMLAALFILLWIYSVADAYVGGKRVDAAEERKGVS